MASVIQPFFMRVIFIFCRRA